MRSNLMAIMANMFGNKKTESAKERRVKKDRRVNTPPRSMTESEKEYYAIHKNLNGFAK